MYVYITRVYVENQFYMEGEPIYVYIRCDVYECVCVYMARMFSLVYE